MEGPRKKNDVSVPVSAVMVPKVYSCTVGDSLQIVAELMRDLGCNCLPITDEEGHAVGVVTHRDVCNAAAREELALAAIPVENAMSLQVVSCREDEPLSAALARMQEYGIHRLPVVDADSFVVGLLSLGHVARRLVGGEDLGVDSEAVLAALAGIPVSAPDEPEDEVTAA